MELTKTRSLKNLEQKMESAEPGSLRYKALESAKNFKTSWIELGQTLYSVWKDKLYKEWGYLKFESYTSREIGIRKQTAVKLLRSYFFLEKEEPSYLKKEYPQSADAAAIPNYESVNLLRLAKNKKALDNYDYQSLKKSVFEQGKDAPQIRKDLTALIRQRQELEPEEAREKQRSAKIKRFLTILKTLKEEIEASKMLPALVIKEVAQLIKKLEAEIE